MADSAPASLVAIAARVEARLREFLEPEQARWAQFDSDLAEPIAHIGRLVLAGGKRLRPAFCHWGFVGAGGDPADPMIINAGAAFELMHAFALFHDDVMDDAASRRGNATTHAVFAERHREQGWAGEARRFGEGVAILVGDLAFVYSDMMMAGASSAAWAIWNELRIVSISAKCSTSRAACVTNAVDKRPNRSVATRVASTQSSDRCISVQ